MTAPAPATVIDPGLQDEPGLPDHPSDILLELIVCVLAPLFMAGCAGDIGFARLAAIETLASYHARTQAELVKIAQIVAFGVAAMDNLRLSMTPDLSLSMIVRLRAGANALNRAAQQNARALEKARRDNPLPRAGSAEPPPMAAAGLAPHPMSDDDEITDIGIQAAIERARALVKAAHDGTEAASNAPLPSAPQPADIPPVSAQPDSVPQPPAPLQPPSPAARRAPITAEQRRNLMWADAMTAVAGELSGNLAAVPAARHATDRMWASALTSTASSLALAAGSVPPGADIGIERVAKRAKPT